MIKKLVRSLKGDADYRRAWRDNISMAFQDEMKRSARVRPSSVDLREIANTAAENFLDNLTKKRQKTKKIAKC